MLRSLTGTHTCGTMSAPWQVGTSLWMHPGRGQVSVIVFFVFGGGGGLRGWGSMKAEWVC